MPLHTLNAPRISIHAPLRERLKWSKRLPKPRPFQSTLPCGSDRWVPAEQQILLCISIHAPLRERLVMLVLVIIVLINFNPRSLAGATVRTSTIDHNYNKFQSTLPCGSDAVASQIDAARRHFNPRSLAGATVLFLSSVFFVIISIHAPLRERQFFSYLLCFLS